MGTKLGVTPVAATAAALAAVLLAAPLVCGKALESGHDEPALALEQSRDIPSTIWFQGFLADQDTGDPITATYDIIARIYADPGNGALVWGPEPHNGVQISEGWFNIELGATEPLPDFATPPYYLQLTVDGENLSPRQKLGSVPAAFRAGEVDQVDDDWRTSEDDIYRTIGRVGIGTQSPDCLLDIEAGSEDGLEVSSSGTGNEFTIRGTNTSGTAAGFFSDVDSPASPAPPAAVFAEAGNGNTGGFFRAHDGGRALLGQGHDTSVAVEGFAFGTGLAGYFHGGSGVYVDGQVEMTGFRLFPTSMPQYALTNVGSGVGEWQPQHIIDYHDEGATISLGTAFSPVQYDDTQVSITAPGTGYIVVTAKVMVNLSHTQGTTDLCQIGITRSADTWDTGWHSIIHDEIPAAWPTDTEIYQNYATHRVFEVHAPGDYSFYLIGEMASGWDAADLFWWAHMSAIYYPTPDPAGRERDEIPPDKLEWLKSRGLAR